jgi:hypothetical protein
MKSDNFNCAQYASHATAVCSNSKPFVSTICVPVSRGTSSSHLQPVNDTAVLHTLHKESDSMDEPSGIPHCRLVNHICVSRQREASASSSTTESAGEQGATQCAAHCEFFVRYNDHSNDVSCQNCVSTDMNPSSAPSLSAAEQYDHHHTVSATSQNQIKTLLVTRRPRLHTVAAVGSSSSLATADQVGLGTVEPAEKLKLEAVPAEGKLEPCSSLDCSESQNSISSVEAGIECLDAEVVSSSVECKFSAMEDGKCHAEESDLSAVMHVERFEIQSEPQYEYDTKINVENDGMSATDPVFSISRCTHRLLSEIEQPAVCYMLCVGGTPEHRLSEAEDSSRSSSVSVVTQSVTDSDQSELHSVAPVEPLVACNVLTVQSSELGSDQFVACHTSSEEALESVSLEAGEQPLCCAISEAEVAAETLLVSAAEQSVTCLMSNKELLESQLFSLSDQCSRKVELTGQQVLSHSVLDVDTCVSSSPTTPELLPICCESPVVLLDKQQMSAVDQCPDSDLFEQAEPSTALPDVHCEATRNSLGTLYDVKSTVESFITPSFVANEVPNACNELLVETYDCGTVSVVGGCMPSDEQSDGGSDVLRDGGDCKSANEQSDFGVASSPIRHVSADSILNADSFAPSSLSASAQSALCHEPLIKLRDVLDIPIVEHCTEYNTANVGHFETCFITETEQSLPCIELYSETVETNFSSLAEDYVDIPVSAEPTSPVNLLQLDAGSVAESSLLLNAVEVEPDCVQVTVQIASDAVS